MNKKLYCYDLKIKEYQSSKPLTITNLNFTSTIDLFEVLNNDPYLTQSFLDKKLSKYLELDTYTYLEYRASCFSSILGWVNSRVSNATVIFEIQLRETKYFDLDDKSYELIVAYNKSWFTEK